MTDGRQTPPRVLLVDDNVDFTRMLSKLLELSGCVVRVAHDGPLALDVYQEFQPQAVLLDLGLPKLDGYEVCRRIRQTHGSEGVLIAVLSGYGRDCDKSRSVEAGANAHFLKPVEHGQVVRFLVQSGLLSA